MKKNASRPTQEESLRQLGLDNLGKVYWDLPTSALYEEAIRRYEAALGHLGPLVVRTGQYTGRLPKDKFLVREPCSENKIAWGKINRPLEPGKVDALNIGCAPISKAKIFLLRTATRERMSSIASPFASSASAPPRPCLPAPCSSAS